MALVKPSERVGGMGQAFRRTKHNDSKLLWEKTGLIKFSVGVGGINQAFCWRRGD